MQEFFKNELQKSNDMVGTNLQEYKPDNISRPKTFNSASKAYDQSVTIKQEHTTNNNRNQKYSYIESKTHEKTSKLCKICFKDLPSTNQNLLCDICNARSKNKGYESISIDRFVNNDNDTNILLEKKLRENKNKTSLS